MGQESDFYFQLANGFFSIITSWTFVYLLLFGPILLMGCNFIFGQCALAEFIDMAKGGSAPAARTPSDNLFATGSPPWQGRAYVAIVFLCLVIQPWAYTYCLYPALTSTLGDVLLRWNVPSLSVIGQILISDILYYSFYLFSWLILMFLFMLNVVSASHREEAAKTSDVRPCFDCHSYITNKDHHCYFINNCVTSYTYRRFIAFLLAVVVNTAFLAMTGRFVAMRVINDIFILLTSILSRVIFSAPREPHQTLLDPALSVLLLMLYFVAIMFMLASAAGLGWYLLLFRYNKDITTARFLRLVRPKRLSTLGILDFLIKKKSA